MITMRRNSIGKYEIYKDKDFYIGNISESLAIYYKNKLENKELNKIKEIKW